MFRELWEHFVKLAHKEGVSRVWAQAHANNALFQNVLKGLGQTIVHLGYETLIGA